MTRITLQVFKKVVRKVLEDSDVAPDEADKIAEKVMYMFGYDDMITDNILTTKDRNYFYLLEDHDILTSEEETVTLPSGRRWRIHYWRIKEKKIREILKEEEDIEEDETGIYDEVYEDVWAQVEGKR